MQRRHDSALVLQLARALYARCELGSQLTCFYARAFEVVEAAACRGDMLDEAGQRARWQRLDTLGGCDSDGGEEDERGFEHVGFRTRGMSTSGRVGRRAGSKMESGAVKYQASKQATATRFTQDIHPFILPTYHVPYFVVFQHRTLSSNPPFPTSTTLLCAIEITIITQRVSPVLGTRVNTADERPVTVT